MVDFNPDVRKMLDIIENYPRDELFPALRVRRGDTPSMKLEFSLGRASFGKRRVCAFFFSELNRRAEGREVNFLGDLLRQGPRLGRIEGQFELEEEIL